MKINTSKVQHLIKEYSTNIRKSKNRKKDPGPDTVKISGHGKRKVVYKKTVNELFGKLVKNNSSHQKT